MSLTEMKAEALERTVSSEMTFGRPPASPRGSQARPDPPHESAPNLQLLAGFPGSFARAVRIFLDNRITVPYL